MNNGSPPEIFVLLDVSGSMDGKEAAMVEAVNSALASIPMESIPVTITMFNNNMWNLVEHEALSKKPRITVEQYKTNGSTALYDSIGRTLEECPNGSTIIVATDGEDTSSSDYKSHTIKEVIEGARTLRGITFMFVCEGENALQEGCSIGLQEGTPGVHVFSAQSGAPLSQAIQEESFKERLSQLVSCMSQQETN